MAIPLNKFEYNSTTNVLNGFISDMGEHAWEAIPGTESGMGVQLLHPSGKKMTFILTNTKRDNDGDIVMWILEPIRRTSNGLVMVIHND